VWVDESAFTVKTYQTQAWTLRNTNVELAENQLRIKRVNLIAAVSLEHGLEAVLTTMLSRNSRLFYKILP
jgi:hypothetical protein